MRAFFLCVVAIFAFTQLQRSVRGCAGSLENASVEHRVANAMFYAADANASPVPCDASPHNGEGGERDDDEDEEDERESKTESGQDDDANDSLATVHLLMAWQDSCALSICPVSALPTGFDEKEPALRPPRA